MECVSTSPSPPGPNSSPPQDALGLANLVDWALLRTLTNSHSLQLHCSLDHWPPALHIHRQTPSNSQPTTITDIPQLPFHKGKYPTNVLTPPSPHQLTSLHQSAWLPTAAHLLSTTQPRPLRRPPNHLPIQHTKRPTPSHHQT
jgi:hypothetical protein